VKQAAIKFPARPKGLIRWQGKSRSLAVAGALAARQQQIGDLAGAVEIYELILAKMPDQAEIHNNLGVLLQTMKRHEAALASYDRAIALKSDYANAHFNRGSVLKEMHRDTEALASYERALAIKPGHAEAHNNRGGILREMRLYDDALASYDRAIAAKPDYAEAYNNRGIVLFCQGHMPEAEEMFLKAFELKPDFSDPLFNLSNIRHHENAGHADIENIRQLLDRPGGSPDSREQLYFALGKIYDDCNLYNEAFECHRIANQMRNRHVVYDRDETRKMTDGIMEVFSNDFLARPFASASDSATPLFVVGFPRSGTTLLATMLSNHRSIATAGELATITDFAAQLRELTGNGTGYPQAARHIAPALAARLIHDYEKRLRRDAGPEVLGVIDKNPLNFRNLGLISLLFPKARVIHCTRDPLDTCLSNYFQRFPLFMSYSFDLQNIGHFYREYVRLMEHWRKTAAVRMIEVSYEDLVCHTEKTARKMLDFLELEWDERCVAPHTNPCPVETGSQWQVRQPIYPHSVGRWRHYEKHLDPLKEALKGSSI